MAPESQFQSFRPEAGQVIDVSNEADRQLGEISDQPLTYTSPDKATVSNVTGELVAAAADQYVEIFVPDTADTGIHINFGAAATTNKWFIPAGSSWRGRTSQAINAIRAGSTNVTVHVLTGVVA